MNGSTLSDIVIVGAGLVGMPLAQVLAAQGWQVVLLDAEPAKPSRSGTTADLNATMADEHASMRLLRQRCTALSLGTQRWFASHDLWSGLADDAAPIRQVVVSHKGYFGATRLQAAEMGVDALGYVLNNQHLVECLQSRLAETSVEHRSNVRVVAVKTQQNSVEVQLSAGEAVQARLLIAADGVGSVVRESAGISTRQVDYQQAAVLSMVKLADAHHDVAHERFTDSGPLAVLPRPGPYVNVIECIEPDDQTAMKALDEEAYLAHLQARFGHRLGHFDAAGPRVVLPLVRIEATAQCASRIVLLGNAMRLLHPVGGQGYNLAMRDVDCLVRQLQRQRGSDPGEARLLAEFVAIRQADQLQVVRFTDTLARSFRGKASLPAHARSAALLGLDTLGPLRRRFARRSMGLFS